MIVDSYVSPLKTGLAGGVERMRAYYECLRRVDLSTGRRSGSAERAVAARRIWSTGPRQRRGTPHSLERDIDISGEYPKPRIDEIVCAADVVVTIGEAHYDTVVDRA
jgi:hypothetical protein